MFRQLRPYYTSAALRGGGAYKMRRLLRGGWDTAEKTPVFSDSEQTALAAILKSVTTKYGLSDAEASQLVNNIYYYDNLIAKGDRDGAVIAKRMFVQGDPIRGKVWNYARRYIHLGYIPTKEQRKALMKASRDARLELISDYEQALANPSLPWLGSADAWEGIPPLPTYKNVISRLNRLNRLTPEGRQYLDQVARETRYNAPIPLAIPPIPKQEEMEQA